MADILTPPALQHTSDEDHASELERRQAERDAKRDLLLDCLDPRVAAKYEMQKPCYRWKVRCMYRKPDEKDRRMKTYEYELEVVAQNEDGAWAVFCDKTGCRYPRKNCRELEIKKLKKLDVSELLSM